MAKDTFYFSHDYNARNDSKIKKLLSVHGYNGYGLFWAIIEDLYNNTNVLRLDYESIAFDLRTNPPIIESIINDFDLFAIEGDIFGSKSIEKRLEDRNNKSQKARDSVLKRWQKNTNVLPTNYDSNTIKERKGKESKVKEKVQILDSLFFTNDEIEKLKILYGIAYETAINYLNNYKTANGKKYKSDYHAMIGWVKEKFIQTENKQQIKQMVY